MPESVSLLYRNSCLTLSLPPCTLQSFEPHLKKHTLTADNFSDSLYKSGFQPEVWQDGGLVIVNDGYRNTPTSLILDWLEQYSPRLLVGLDYLVSTGTHPAPTEKHLQAIFGRHLPEIRPNIHIHDCKKTDDLERIGVDQFSKEFFINKRVLAANRILVIGSVEPHYFAGFTGGRKSFFPGLTDFATVERNHNLANSLDAAPLKLERNPVAEHLQNLTDLLPPHKEIISIQAVLDAHEQLAGLFIGNLDSSFQQAVKLAHELYSYSVERPFDAVLCELLPPLDSNLYQTQKPLENVQAAVRDGGLVVVFASCHEGVGSEYFFRQAAEWDRAANRPNDGIFRFGSHKLSRVVAISRRLGAYVFSSLPPEDVRHVFLEPVDNVEALLSRHASVNPEYRIALVRNAANVVLRHSDRKI